MTGDLQDKLTEDRLIREKAQFLLLLMCTEVHKKEVKFKEVIRFGGLYTI